MTAENWPVREKKRETGEGGLLTLSCRRTTLRGGKHSTCLEGIWDLRVIGGRGAIGVLAVNGGCDALQVGGTVGGSLSSSLLSYSSSRCLDCVIRGETQGYQAPRAKVSGTHLTHSRYLVNDMC